jgi:dipeptidyl aminopeptidase/acylaminoacyl peptidase
VQKLFKPKLLPTKVLADFFCAHLKSMDKAGKCCFDEAYRQLCFLVPLIAASFNFFTPILQGNEMNSPTAHSKITVANYGTWTSPITAEKIAEGETAIINMLVDEKSTYWCELRPNNRGRYTIVKRDADGNLQDMTPPDFNVRTFVHEYGGGAFTVSKGIIYASNGSDNAVYMIKPDSFPIRITQGQERININGLPKWKGVRFADMHHTRYGLVAVGENHDAEKPVENFLALIDIQSGAYKKLAYGFDFYSSPVISKDEKKIAWICWNHPEMPWTNTELWVADIEPDGSLKNPKRIAGEIPEAIFQPQWSPDGILYFVTDRDRGWWNLHRYEKGKIENICPMEAEVAEPLWVFQKSTYAFLGAKIAFAYNKNGAWHLGISDPETKQWQPIDHNSVSIQQMRSGENCVQFLEGYAQAPQSIMQLDNTAGYHLKILFSKDNPYDIGYLSMPQHIVFPSNGRVSYGFYYAPANKDFRAPEGEKPPLIVMSHGGPTSQARSAFQLKMQYWTSRGFAVLDVDYGGSTGYGRAYRNLLNNSWGIVDVEDCVNGALFLVKKGLADPDKLVIRGGSAGGYTTLAALAFKHTFKAGASYYGVADITALAHDTHKFEQRYMEQLIGKYPEEKKLWEARSPINSVDKIKCPLILFQGENDPIVPMNQSVMIFEALKKRGIIVELHVYPGEEHGFRQLPNIVHSLNREKDFYLEVFGLAQQKMQESEYRIQNSE